MIRWQRGLFLSDPRFIRWDLVRESVSVFKSILKYQMTLPVLEPSQKQNRTPLKLCIIYFMLMCPIVYYWHFMGFILGLCITHVNQNVFLEHFKDPESCSHFLPCLRSAWFHQQLSSSLQSIPWDPFRGINCISHLSFNIPFIFSTRK